MPHFHRLPTARQAWDYYVEYLCRESYLGVGRWHGQGAYQLGLAGEEVTPEAFASFAHMPRAPASNKQGELAGYDLCFGVPTSVTVMYAVQRVSNILPAFVDGVQETMREMEQTMGGLLWASFAHLTDNPMDGNPPQPLLHLHNVVFDAAYDKAGRRWHAVDFMELLDQADFIEALAAARLAKRLTEMGYGIARDDDMKWEIAGVPQSVIDKFQSEADGGGCPRWDV